MHISTTRRRALVLGDDTRAFLTVIRSLGRLGLDVEVAWCPLDSPALSSRYVTAVHQLEDYRADNTAWLRGLKSLLTTRQFEIVVPCSDRVILPLQRYRAELAPLCYTLLAPPDAFNIFASKRLTHDLACSLGIPTAQQRVALDRAAIDAAVAEFGLPAVLKPVASVTDANPASKQYVRTVRSRGALEGLADEMLRAGPVLVESHVPGCGEGIAVLCRDGELLTAFQYRRVHEPLNGGGSSYRVSVPLDEEMLEAVRRLMRAVKYEGVAMVEFKRDKPEARWHLIEVNARFWGSLALAIAAGMDFPRFAYEAFCRGRRDFPMTYRTGVYCRHWIGDLHWLRANLRADRTDPYLHVLPLHALIPEVIRIATLREGSDEFQLRDPQPAAHELWQLVAPKVLRRLRNTFAGRRVLQRRARAALSRASVVLVVCKGNICRSPFAARLLQARAPDLHFVSTGLLPDSGRRPPCDAVHAASVHGIDLSAHRSSYVTAAQIAAADVIFVCDDDHRRIMQARFPEARAKIHLLGALDRHGPLVIADPHGGTAEQFRACYAAIANAVRVGLGARSGRLDLREPA